MSKIRIFSKMGFVALFAVCSAQDRHLTVRVTNPEQHARIHQTVSIPWNTLRSTLGIGERQSLMVKDSTSGGDIASQAFDSNLDGIPDEFIFQSGFGPRESRTFFVQSTPKNPREVSSLTDIRFVEPRQDLAWENDRIAFRMYGPALAAEVNNGIDVWTKRVRYLIVKKWYDGEEQTPKIVYHEDHGEGADFFNVGRSLGCGGSGIWFKNKVYQPGVFTSYKIISTGPIRASFELYYGPWDFDGKKLTETKRITLDAGQNLNRIDVTYANSSQSSPLEIACGLVKRNNTKSFENKSRGWMSLWGQTNDSLQNGYLGTGIVFEQSKLTGVTEDKDQYIMLGKTRIGSQFTYYAGAGWTRSRDFNSEEAWNKYLDAFSQELRSPLLVTITMSSAQNNKQR
jgi:pectinesterase